MQGCVEASDIDIDQISDMILNQYDQKVSTSFGYMNGHSIFSIATIYNSADIPQPLRNPSLQHNYCAHTYRGNVGFGIFAIFCCSTDIHQQFKPLPPVSR